MNTYRVRVNVWVAVEASNAKSAKAIAENAVRRAVKEDYAGDTQGDCYADGWELFGFQAVGTPEKVGEDE